VIRYATSSYDTRYDTSCLIHPATNLPTYDVRDIHLLLTTHFKQWFANHPDFSTPLHQRNDHWEQLYYDRAYFMAYNEPTNVPPHLLDHIWSALQLPTRKLDVPTASSPTLRDLFHSTLQSPPTLDEFRATLRRTSNNSSPGMSGLSYNHIKSWPTEILELTHQLLTRLWESKHVPPYWKWRWLCMKPKVATDPTPDQLRPLILVETLRKLWLASTCHKITTLWQTHNVLHNSQHAYLRAKGTETALLHICNQLDNARCSFASIYLTQWDIKRAFDSVHPIILKLSWYRLGVPPDVADYLVDLDTQGHTIPRTNAASAAWAANAYANFSADPQGDQLPTFTAERGTGQGDVQSALAWDAFYDILLTALSLLPTDRLYTSTSTNSFTAHNDEAFADDLNSLSPTVAAQQSVADLICAFAIVFG